MSLPGSQAAIETRGLAKRFGKRTAVRGLDLSVMPGQCFGFLGPNGAGKSTTIRMLLGLVRPSAGLARVFGADVAVSRTSALAHVGALVETPSFYSYLTGRENLRLFAGLSGPVDESAIASTLDVVGLGSRGDDRVKAYSHGMKQRLAIGCAMLPRPKLVILDEPTNGLDPEGVMEVRQLIGAMTREQNLTVFLSSHLLFEVEQVCTHVAVIANGQALAHGPVEELLGSGFGPVEFETERAQEAAEEVRVRFDQPPLWVSEARFAVNIEHAAAAEVNSWLVGRGFRVTGIERKKQSLEDFYLRLMRQQESA